MTTMEPSVETRVEILKLAMEQAKAEINKESVGIVEARYRKFLALVTEDSTAVPAPIPDLGVDEPTPATQKRPHQKKP